VQKTIIVGRCSENRVKLPEMRRNLQEFIEDVSSHFILNVIFPLFSRFKTNICKIAKDVCHISSIQPLGASASWRWIPGLTNPR
jgi:hypothetical protein